MNIIELVKELKSADRETAYRLAMENPEFVVYYSREFHKMVREEMVKSCVSEGVLGDNYTGIDELIDLANKWKRACRRANHDHPEVFKAVWKKRADEVRIHNEKMDAISHKIQCKQLKIKKITCKRCGWEWAPRTEWPGDCPNCGSRVWWKPRTGNEPGRKPKKRSSQT